MNKTLAKFSAGIVIASSLLVPVMALAASDVVEIGGDCEDIDCLFGKFVEIANWIFAIALLIAIVLFIVGGVSYMTAGGDDDKTTEARKKLLWGVVGVAVILGAVIIIKVVATFLGAEIPSILGIF